MPTATVAAPPAHPLMNAPQYGPPITIPALPCCGELPGECSCPTMTTAGHLTTRSGQ